MGIPGLIPGCCPKDTVGGAAVFRNLTTGDFGAWSKKHLLKRLPCVQASQTLTVSPNDYWCLCLSLFWVMCCDGWSVGLVVAVAAAHWAVVGWSSRFGGSLGCHLL